MQGMLLHVTRCGNLKACILQCLNDVLHVQFITRLDHDLKFCLLQGYGLHHALVNNLNHVCTRLPDDARDIRKLPRCVINFKCQTCYAAITSKAASDKRGEPARVDIPAA